MKNMEHNRPWCYMYCTVYIHVNTCRSVLVAGGEYGPQVIAQPSDVTALQGTNVTLSCAAQGNPSPFVQWKRPGESTTDRTKAREESTTKRMKPSKSKTESK